MVDEAEKSLTARETAFVAAYLATWNAVEAAKRTGYKGPSLASVRLMKRTHIRAAIQKHLKTLQLETDEILVRLGQQARLNPAMFFTFGWVDEQDENGIPVLGVDGYPVQRRVATGIDWAVFEHYGYLVKKLSYDRKGRPVIEFHDAQHALELLGKAKGMFLDRTELTGLDGTPLVKGYVSVSPDDWDEQ